MLRGNPDAAKWPLAEIRDLAKAAASGELDRLELVELIDRAIAVRGRTAVTTRRRRRLTI